jgi:hypothetical protein
MLARGFPGQARGDPRTRKSGIGDHPGADDMAEFDKPAVCGRHAPAVIRRPSPRSLVRLPVSITNLFLTEAVVVLYAPWKELRRLDCGLGCRGGIRMQLL